MSRHRIAAVIVATALALAGCASSEPPPSAADQVPHLTVMLHRVDAALASHRFTAARQYLKALKAAVLEARGAGDLRESDATRVLDAITRLMATLPAPTPTSSSTPRPESPSATTSRRPTHSRSPRPTLQTSPTPTSTPTPSMTPSTSTSATPTPTPETSTPGPTRKGAPTASASATP